MTSCFMKTFWSASLYLLIVSGSTLGDLINGNQDLLVFTVATEANDGFERFMSSAKRFGYNVKVLGMGEKWVGGDVAKYSGGGQKVRLFKAALEEYKNSANLIVLFVDSYDLVFMDDPSELVRMFKEFEANVVFSAEAFCWPDPSLAEFYPTVGLTEKRYLNSGGFIGYAPQIYSIVSNSEIENEDDDQLYYTKIFLDQRAKLNIHLDTYSVIFQNLNGAQEEVSLKFDLNKTSLQNTQTNTMPIIVHGNGPIKIKFNGLSNYIADQWSPVDGCRKCKEDLISLKDLELDEYPVVFMGLYIEHATAFIEDFFDRIGDLNYPKNRIDLLVHYSVDFHAKDVEKFVEKFGEVYRSVQTHSVELSESAARMLAIDECKRVSCNYYFSVDGDAQLENVETLQTLIERNRSVVAPMLLRPGKMWSNFWGDLSNDGFYKRSDDYVQIIQKVRVGMWNVPYISGAFLIQGRHVNKLSGSRLGTELDADLGLCKLLREKGIFMFVDNQEYYGHLVDSEHFETKQLHNDLYEIFDNRYTWEKKYIHKDYHKVLEDIPFSELKQCDGRQCTDASEYNPCPDVFWFPIVTPKFCKDLVEEMENFGQWSGGKNEDPRLQGGYENVPTVDIHTNQINWERHWLHFLKEYIGPLNSKAFQGYFTEGRAIMNFVVRYRPNEQDRLRPHADSSTFTVNIALNQPGVDYEGGGVHFLRYNCTWTDLRVGWMLMHPGRLTHHHEGLPTTNGTRYIMVSFVDP